MDYREQACTDPMVVSSIVLGLSVGAPEQGSHAQGVYPIQDTSRIETARVKQEEEKYKS